MCDDLGPPLLRLFFDAAAAPTCPFGQCRTEVTGHSIRRGSSKDVKVSPKWGGRGSNPRPTDYESGSVGSCDQHRYLAETPHIACETADLCVADAEAVRLRYGPRLPPVAGVTPG